MAEKIEFPLTPGAPARRLAWSPWTAAAAFALSAFAAFLAYVFSKPAVPLALGGAIVAGLGTAWLMSRPMRIVRLLFILLPFHVMLMVILFGLLGLPENAVRALASWKEAVMAFFVLAILLGVVLSGKKDFLLTPTDLFALLFIFQIIVYVFIAPALGSEISLVGRLYDLRDSTMLLVCYFLGRAMVLEIGDVERLLKMVLVVGGATVAVGLFEWMLIPDNFFVLLGVSTYFKDFLGVQYAGDDWGQGLPGNFWTYMGGLGYVRRSVSVYMNSQGYAITFLVLMPIASYFLLYKPETGWRRIWVFFFHAAGLVSTITRATILTCTIMFFMMAKLAGKNGWVKKGMVTTMALACAGILFSSGIRTLVIETLTFKSDSSISHLSSWAASIDPILQKPLFGHGLSEAGQNSKRFGGKNVGEESTPLRILGETGAVGFLIFYGFWFAYIFEAYAMNRSGTAPWQAKGLCVLGIALCVGFMINGIATDIMSSQYTNFSTGILLGLIRSATKAAESRIPQGAA